MSTFIGKRAYMKTGHYKGRWGILEAGYDYRIHYDGLYPIGFTGSVIVPEKPYVLAYYTPSGEFKCAIEVDLSEVVVEGYPLDGSYYSAHLSGSSTFSGNLAKEIWFDLQEIPGQVSITYGFAGKEGQIKVYRDGYDEPIVQSPLTIGYSNPPLTFDYDPDIHPRKIKIVTTDMAYSYWNDIGSQLIETYGHWRFEVNTAVSGVDTVNVPLMREGSSYSRVYNLGRRTGVVVVNYDLFNEQDEISIHWLGNLVPITKSVNTLGAGTISFYYDWTLAPNEFIEVRCTNIVDGDDVPKDYSDGATWTFNPPS